MIDVIVILAPLVGAYIYIKTHDAARAAIVAEYKALLEKAHAERDAILAKFNNK